MNNVEGDLEEIERWLRGHTNTRSHYPRALLDIHPPAHTQSSDNCNWCNPKYAPSFWAGLESNREYYEMWTSQPLNFIEDQENCNDSHALVGLS